MSDLTNENRKHEMFLLAESVILWAAINGCHSVLTYFFNPNASTVPGSTTDFPEASFTATPKPSW